MEPFNVCACVLEGDRGGTLQTNAIRSFQGLDRNWTKNENEVKKRKTRPTRIHKQVLIPTLQNSFLRVGLASSNGTGNDSGNTSCSRGGVCSRCTSIARTCGVQLRGVSSSFDAGNVHTKKERASNLRCFFLFKNQPREACKGGIYSKSRLFGGLGVHLSMRWRVLYTPKLISHLGRLSPTEKRSLSCCI